MINYKFSNGNSLMCLISRQIFRAQIFLYAFQNVIAHCPARVTYLSDRSLKHSLSTKTDLVLS